MTDYLGLNSEETLKELLITHQLKEAKLFCKDVWDIEKIPSFRFWELLMESKGKEAHQFAKDHVMVRESPIGVYLAYSNCPNSLESILDIPLTKSGKSRLIMDGLVLGAKIGDLDFCSKMLELKADPTILNHEAFKQACNYGKLEIIKLLTNFGVELLCERNYIIKIALKKEYSEILNYIDDKIDIIPITWEEVTNLVRGQKNESIQWLCQKQTKPPKLPATTSTTAKGFQLPYFNFTNIKDCQMLLQTCINLDKVNDNPTSYYKITRDILKYLPLHILKPLSTKTTEEFQPLAKSAYLNKKNKENIKKIIHLLEEKEIEII